MTTRRHSVIPIRHNSWLQTELDDTVTCYVLDSYWGRQQYVIYCSQLRATPSADCNISHIAVGLSNYLIHSARPPKIPGWIVPFAENTQMDSGRPWKFFCRQAGFVENKQLKLYQGLLPVFFSNFMFGFHGFCLKILKIIQLNSNWFLN